MQRRDFLKTALAASTALQAQTSASDTHIEILLNEPIGRIAPEIYGHFVEHLGGVVYDGIWVGEGSKIPNVGGIRKSLIDAFAKIKPGVVRWPGGCFADSYNWRDGIGPRNFRPKRANFWLDSEWPAGAPANGPQKYDPNHFGTIEFLRFAKLVGSQPYMAANLRSLTARDFYEWVDYVNAPAGTTTMSELRAAHGEKNPFGVKYWGVGNESWGCGGNFNPEEYVVEYRRFAEWVPRFEGAPLAFIGSGPNSGDIGWTRRFFGKLAEKGGFGRMWGWGLHHYSWNVTGGKITDWNAGKGSAINYPLNEWYELLADSEKIENLITANWAIMGEFDKQHRVKLVVDEWGSWFKPGSELHNTHLLGQQSTIRDAVLAGSTLNTFHRHADKVAMANIAQLVNCLQALFFAHEDKFALTPTYHVFDLYAAHQGADSLRTLVSTPEVRFDRDGKQAALRGLSASASLTGKTLVLTVANPDPKSARVAEIQLRGGVASGAVQGRVLGSGGDVNAHNTFADPQRIAPKSVSIGSVKGGLLTHTFPAASVTRFDIPVA